MHVESIPVDREPGGYDIGPISRIGTLIVAGVLASTLLASRSTNAQANHLPSEQEVLTFIANTIDWYRHLPTAQRIGTEPADLLFLEDNGPIAREIVKLSFEFGKAVAAFAPPQDSPDAISAPTPPNSSLQYVVAAKASLDGNTQQGLNQLQSLAKARLTARGVERKRLDNQMVEIRSRIQVLKAMSASYQNLLGFVQTATADPERAANMAALVENLERTVPDVSAAAPLSQTSNVSADSSRAPYGIMGMISRVSTLARKERAIDGVIERTDALTKSLQNVRNPFTEPFRKQFSMFSLETKSLDGLRAQQSRLSDLVAQAQAASPAIAALIKQQMLLTLYRTHLSEWGSEAQVELRAAWKALIMRLGVLGAAIAVLLGISAAVRRLACRHVRHPDTRQMLLVGERVLLWLMVIAFVLSAFAFDASSLATFLGLLAAGLAVGLHDVFLAIGGHLLIVRKFHVRVGDRVQISGVIGDVRNLGLMEFELGEIDPATGQRTGRVASFSNSYVFASPATPLFRQLSTQSRASTDGALIDSAA
ncbi:MAG TPA: hypothetical protein VMS18_23435 [Candidatus Binatia bacterium]|nr:hypothetical protein [Candidatus Binatia bacterium]